MCMHSRMYLCISMCVCFGVRQAVGLPDWSIESHLAQLTLHPKASSLFPSSNSTQDVPHSRESVTLLKTYTHCSLLTGCSLSHTHTHTLKPVCHESLLLSLWTHIYMPPMATEDTEKQLMVLMRNCFPHKCTMLFQLHETLVWKQVLKVKHQTQKKEKMY